jgi:hypothetical protein
VLTVIVLGLSWGALIHGPLDKIGGDVLYATLIYVVVILLRPATTLPVAVGWAIGLCWAVEFFQLTPIPAAASRRSVLGRLVLGSTFHWPDLLTYVVGALLGGLLHLLSARSCPRLPRVGRPGRSSRPRNAP